jgi:hypothetical protein
MAARYLLRRTDRCDCLGLCCNLYSITINQAGIIALFRVINRYVGNLPPMPGVFPDYPAPVIRNTDTGTEMVTMRWGMPPPPRTGGPPITNIRNTSSPHWRGWLKPENRCLAPDLQMPAGNRQPARRRVPADLAVRQANPRRGLVRRGPASDLASEIEGTNMHWTARINIGTASADISKLRIG